MTARRIPARQNRPSVRRLAANYTQALSALVEALEAMQGTTPYTAEGIAAMTAVHARRREVDRAASLLLRAIGFNLKLWMELKRQD